MELEIEDLHIQTEDVVKAKISVSSDIPRAQQMKWSGTALIVFDVSRLQSSSLLHI